METLKELEFIESGTPGYFQVYQSVGDGHRSNTHLGDLDLDGGLWFGRHYEPKHKTLGDKFAHGLTIKQMNEIVEFALSAKTRNDSGVDYETNQKPT